LDRLGIRLKCARDHIHSPDLGYVLKVKCVQVCFHRCLIATSDAGVLFQDEMGYYRQPTLSTAYEQRGHRQPLAERSYHSNTPYRITATLNALTGQLVLLPTYAPWTNPIEKLWRWLRQDVIHLHRYADRWDELKQLVGTFRDRFRDGSQDLLRYVGLTAKSHLYGEFFKSAPLHLALRR
jgi:hypothetical protein